jgi:ATP-dependent Clp protease protease subunit
MTKVTKTTDPKTELRSVYDSVIASVKATGALDAINADAARVYAAFKDAESGNPAWASALTAKEQKDLAQVVEANRIMPTVTEVDGGRERAYDLFSLLMKKRIVRLDGQVDDGMAAIACASLMFLWATQPDEPVKVMINSPGGSVLAGLAIYDTMRDITCPVQTQVYGLAASMGSILLVAGDQKLASNNAWIMLHQPLSGGGKSTQQTDIEINAQLITDLREQLTNIYVRHTGLNHDFWDHVLERDTWLTAQQAKAIGFVDDVYATPASKLTPHEEFSRRASKNASEVAGKTTDDLLVTFNRHDSIRQRGEILVALAQDPKFWTPSRIAQAAANAQTVAVVNDNTTKEKAPRRSKKADVANGQ